MPTDPAYCRTPLGETTNLPKPIIEFVSRSKKDLLMDDATQDEMFKEDQIVQSRNIKSLLCSIILDKRGTLAILYMENNLASGAFTPERLELIKMITTQAATSLENALLYKNLENKVISRTQELKNKNSELERANEENQNRYR